MGTGVGGTGIINRLYSIVFVAAFEICVVLIWLLMVDVSRLRILLSVEEGPDSGTLLLVCVAA